MVEPSPKPTERTRVRRKPSRGSYDREVIDEILDRALVCHVGFVEDGQPFVTPTIHARRGDTLYLHGSPSSRTLAALPAGRPAASPPRSWTSWCSPAQEGDRAAVGARPRFS